MALTGSSRYLSQLKTLMRILYITETVVGANGGDSAEAMYRAGKDQALGECGRTPRSDDVDEALAHVLSTYSDELGFEMMSAAGSGDGWVESEGRRSAWFVFRQCPMMMLAQSAGTQPGGPLCQAFHGAVAGGMELALNRRVELEVAHWGPRACKLLMELWY